MSPASRSAELEAAIGRTRVELGRTLDSLARKLAARRLLEEGLTMVTHSFAEDGGVRRRLVEAVRADPVPIALIAVGVLWLVAGNTGLVERVARDERVRGAVRQIVDVASTIGAAGAKGAGGEGWAHRAAGAARDAVGMVRETGNVVIERAGGYAGYASERATCAAEQASQVWRDNALLFGAVGFVLGAVTAALLPLTRLETE